MARRNSELRLKLNEAIDRLNKLKDQLSLMKQKVGRQENEMLELKAQINLASEDEKKVLIQKYVEVKKRFTKMRQDVAIKKQEIKIVRDDLFGLKFKLRHKRNKVGAISISEHAIVRYFERVLGYDLDEIRKTILPDSTLKLAEKLGSGTFPANDFKIKIVDGMVITLFK